MKKIILNLFFVSLINKLVDAQYNSIGGGYQNTKPEYTLPDYISKFLIMKNFLSHKKMLLLVFFFSK